MMRTIHITLMIGKGCRTLMSSERGYRTEEPSVMADKLSEYRKNYEKVLLSKEGYYEIFAHKMNKVFA